MEPIFLLLTVLVFLLVLFTIIGLVVWLNAILRLRQLAAQSKHTSYQDRDKFSCASCNQPMDPDWIVCQSCGETKRSALLKDLVSTENQMERLYRKGVIDNSLYETIRAKLGEERGRLSGGVGPLITQPVKSRHPPPAKEQRPTVFDSDLIASAPRSTESSADLVKEQETQPEFLSVPSVVEATQFSDEGAGATPVTPQLVAREPRKPLTEIVSAFMEQSNIRWGEIIGGLLIIGCSTALVVSLWAEIAQIPVLKFLIFTTVTAALFAIGLYTARVWKLPTTSHGILTTATLLVPLNFLAIAAVSSGNLPSSGLLIISELTAPAVFLCLVYFAGRVLTPSWPHLLTFGVLGSSVGQLLVRHFAEPSISPLLLTFLGAFPIVCYVAGAAWVVRKIVTKSEILEEESTSVFITLGAITFAAVLPFGLLLYKTGPVGITMMYLAPLVTLAGLPSLAVGAILWRRIIRNEFLPQQTAGISIAILGTITVLLGMILAWPNPASIVPAALINFAAFTGIAIWLRIPGAHYIASLSFALAYLVVFHVAVGNVSWKNIRVTSLLRVSVSAESGQAFALVFVLFLTASEWLKRKSWNSESLIYLRSATLIAATSLLLLTVFGLGIPADPYAVTWIFALYAAGAFWIGTRLKTMAFAWIGSALLLAALAQASAQWLDLLFPWQTAFLMHTTLCTAAALVVHHYSDRPKDFAGTVLNLSGLISAFIVVVCLFEARSWQITSAQAQRVWWLSAIALGLLVLNRRHGLFTLLQVGITSAVVLSTKAVLQQYDWYAYLPQAFLHPWSLQIQGTLLILTCLGWTTLRLFAKKSVAEGDGIAGLRTDAERLLNASWAFDRLLSWAVFAAFLLLVFYSAWSGVAQELGPENETRPWDIAGFPHQEAFGLGSWIVLGLLLISLMLNFRERGSTVYALGAVTALTAVSPLLAAHWETQVATASAWRWFAAVFLFVASLPIWFRRWISERWPSLRWPGFEANDRFWSRIREVLLVSTIAPIVVLTAYPALRAVYYMPVHGPSAGFFFLLDTRFLYSVPLLLVAFALIGYAVREQLSAYAFAGGLFLNFAVTLIYLLSVVAVNGSMNRIVAAHVFQLNALVGALYALLWLSMHARWRRRLSAEQAGEAESAFVVQIGSCVVINFFLIIPAATKLITLPDQIGQGTFAVGSFLGWLSFLSCVIAAGLFLRLHQWDLSGAHLFATLLGTACLLSFSAARWDTLNWTGFHTLISGTTLTSFCMLWAKTLPSRFATEGALKSFAPRLHERWQWDCVLWATLGGFFTVLLSFRARADDPSTAWWHIGPTLAVTVLFAALHWQTLKRFYLYAAGIVLTVAASFWWRIFVPSEPAIHAVLITLSGSSIIWMIMELRARKLSPPQSHTWLSFHNVAAFVVLPFIISMVGGSLLSGNGAGWVNWPEWLSVTSLLALLVACLWDERARHSIASLCLTILLMIGLGFYQLELPSQHLGWALTIALGIFSLISGLAWSFRSNLMQLTDRLSIPRRIDSTVKSLPWLLVFTICSVAIVGTSAYWIDLSVSDQTLRATASFAVALQAVTLALVAEGNYEAPLRRGAIAVLLAGVVLLGWSWLSPGTSGTWLNRAVILMVLMVSFTVFYVFLHQWLREKPEWAEAVRICVPGAVAAGILALIFTLGTEVFYQVNFGAVRINSLALIAISLTLVSVVAVSVVFALSPQLDPLGLSETGRTRYVYAAEVVLALLFMHIRLTMPWLFSGFFERHWPIVVMVIAYLGVISSEALRRRNLLVLAHPIERTGAFLPLLPVLGFWMVQSEVDYSLLLFLAGAVYGGLSILRRSFAFGLLAALAGNGGLWYLLHRTQNYGLLQHPQLWLIPVALSILLAAYLNRERLTEEQLTGTRYSALLMIYASSTADIFFNGVADSPWLPLILGALSLCGIFAGISFRIRGLLLLGSIFLLLAIITMIYYASVNLGWTWLWYVAGIVTGATIIFMFAVFEKKRVEVLRVVEGLREWDS